LFLSFFRCLPTAKAPNESVRSHNLLSTSHLRAQNKTNVPKEFLASGIAAVSGIVVLYSVGIASLCSLVGFSYPAYKSLQAIETKVRGDDTQWLVYWVLYTFFGIIEVFVDLLLYWIPFYFAFKLAFLLWLMLPQTKGATFMYDAFLKDFLKKNESRIDAAMADAKKQATGIASEFTSASGDVAAAAASVLQGSKKTT
jgi:receptor expression-enhancing protein 5/6